MNLDRSYFEYWTEMRTVLEKLPHEQISNMKELIFSLPSKSGQLLTIGNGGSASNAEHASCDLSKGLTLQNPGINFRSTCLTSNSSLLTAWSNDTSYDEAIGHLILSQGNGADVLLAISGSGNSKNILRGIDVAKSLGITTVGLTGFNGGKVSKMVDLEIRIESDDMQIVENLHLAVIHSLVKLCTVVNAIGEE
jgi:D-sedoheptulose 7-phosphate isomerase